MCFIKKPHIIKIKTLSKAKYLIYLEKYLIYDRYIISYDKYIIHALTTIWKL